MSHINTTQLPNGHRRAFSDEAGWNYTVATEHGTKTVRVTDTPLAAIVAAAATLSDDAFHMVGVALPPLDTRPSLGVSAGFAADQRVVDEGEVWDAQNWYAATQGC